MVPGVLADPDVLLGGDGRWIAVALAGVVALSVVRALVRRSRRRPRPGEIWFAFVPFEDGTGGKDRPVLVLSVEGRTCTVARFTSTDRSARRDYRRVPDGVPGLRRTSWVSLHPVRLRRRTMRRRAGAPGLPLVEWFEDAAGLR